MEVLSGNRATLKIGNFKEGQKYGTWLRYDKNDQLEYQELFKEGKFVKKKKGTE